MDENLGASNWQIRLTSVMHCVGKNLIKRKLLISKIKMLSGEEVLGFCS